MTFEEDMDKYNMDKLELGSVDMINKDFIISMIESNNGVVGSIIIYENIPDSDSLNQILETIKIIKEDAGFEYLDPVKNKEGLKNIVEIGGGAYFNFDVWDEDDFNIIPFYNSMKTDMKC